MQTQADIIQEPVKRPSCIETTAMGAAYLAGLAVGYWSNEEDVKANWSIDRVFEPAISEEKQEKKLPDGIRQFAMPLTGQKKNNLQEKGSYNRI